MTNDLVKALERIVFDTDVEEVLGHDVAQQIRDALAAHRTKKQPTVKDSLIVDDGKKLSEVVKTAPEKIWLQISDDIEHYDEPFPANGGDVSWCWHQATTCEVPYVRADLAQKPEQTAHAVPVVDRQASLPERDRMLSNKAQAVYRKYEVRRTDGKDLPGERHQGCEYFVLDVTHDPHAKAALQAYADACDTTHMFLAADMRDRYGLHPLAPAQSVINQQMTTDDGKGQAERKPQWLPIETAPKDGTTVLLSSPGRVTVGEWHAERWSSASEYHASTDEYLGQHETDECIEAGWVSWDGGFTTEDPPTLWMPLPEPTAGITGSDQT